MLDVLPIPLPWYIVGPLMGLTNAGFYAVVNMRLGVSGAYVEALQLIRDRSTAPW